jgi:hypothetical protein
MELPLRLGPIVMADILKWPNATRERRCRRTVSERESAHGANVKFTTRFPRLIFNRFQRNIKDLPVLDGRSHNHVKFAACCHADARATPGSHAVYTQKVFSTFAQSISPGWNIPPNTIVWLASVRQSVHPDIIAVHLSFFCDEFKSRYGRERHLTDDDFRPAKRKKTHSAVSFKHRDPNRVWPLFLLLFFHFVAYGT